MWKITIEMDGSSFSAIKTTIGQALQHVNRAETWDQMRVRGGWGMGVEQGNITIRCEGPLEAQLEEAKRRVRELEEKISGCVPL